MTNAWSLLYDELNMTKTLGEDYGYMLNLGTPIPGGMSDDTITFTGTGYDGRIWVTLVHLLHNLFPTIVFSV